MQLQEIRLNRIVASDDNPRRDVKKGAKDGQAMLEASIRHHGLLQPLIVRMNGDGKFEVVAGARRLRALKAIHKGAKAKEQPAIPCFVRDGDGEDGEIAVAENVCREPLHPVDEYRAYADWVAKGSAPADIAARFGVAERWVRQRLQLARLAPELLDAWRAGKMDADQAAALSATDDHDRQKQAWAGAKKDGWSDKPINLRRAVCEDASIDKSHMFQFVGEAAYVEAGGRFSEDLFAEDRMILDRPVLESLARRKLHAECDRLRADGWSWANTPDQLGQYRWSIARIDLAPYATSEEQEIRSSGGWREARAVEEAIIARIANDRDARGKSGVVVDIGEAGAFAYELLMEARIVTAAGADEEDEAAEDEPAAVAEASPPKPPEKINFALREDLSETLTRAVGQALAKTPVVAARALAATLRMLLDAPASSAPPLSLRIETLAAVRDAYGHDGDAALTFERAFAEAIDDPYPDQTLASLIGRLLDLRHPRYDNKQWSDALRRRIVKTIAAAIDEELLAAEIDAAFDVEGYFKRLPIPEIKACLGDQLGHLGALPAAKGALVALAAKEAKQARWRPPEIAIAFAQAEAPR